ncbi:MAG TPA: transcription antitermination factor NusB [Jiangellaceae bacterium]|nr:transcription antitermination factor NusB [Jiangellaceae bacterium]
MTRRRGRTDPVRSAAFEVLRAVAERDSYANLVLPGLLRERGITGRDAALATELTYGTLRGKGTYDAVLGACVDRPLEALDPPVLDVLRLGAHQVLATRIPPHAAVDTTVDLARAKVGEGPATLVNAVMRRLTTHDLAGWIDQIAPVESTDPIARLALRHAHPPWVVRAFLDSLDGDRTQLEAALAADNERPQVTLVARPGRAGLAELEAAGARPARWSRHGAVLTEGDPAGIPAVRERRAGIQDEGSQLVTVALAAAPLEGSDHRWLDMCSGPGGKAALLAGLATDRGATLLAVERQPHRARMVENALRGDAGNHRVVVADATQPLPGEDPFDRVLLDAPCTGLGALRRRPEARWRRRPSDIPALRALQLALLRAALAAVRPGGLVAYVTCSPHLAETSTVVSDVLRHRIDVERVDARPLLPGVPMLGDGPDVQLWPHRHGTDAMYLALLRRR